jgi:hypothetical protein
MMSSPRERMTTMASLAIRVLACVVAMNALFYLFNGTRFFNSVDRINLHVLNAFKTGDFDFNDYSMTYSYGGMDRFSDAYLMMQLQTAMQPAWKTFLVVPRPPRIIEGISYCKNLYQMSMLVRAALDQKKPLPLTTQYLHHYWEGQLTICSFLLAHFELMQVHLILIVLSYFAFGAMGMAAQWVSREAFLGMAPVVVFGFFFSSIPGVGPLMVHLGFAVSILGVVLFLLAVDAKNDVSRVACMAAVVGALAVYVDQLTGATLQAFCLAGPAAFYLARKREQGFRETPWPSALEATYALAAWTGTLAGVVLSYGLKLLVQCCLFGYRETFLLAYTELNYRMNHATVAEAFASLWNHFDYLAFWDHRLACAVLAASVAAWVVSAAVLAAALLGRMAGRTRGYPAVFMLNLVASLIIIAWYVVFRDHTHVHSFFMGRYLYLPMAFGWSNLTWLLGARAASGRPGGPCERAGS